MRVRLGVSVVFCALVAATATNRQSRAASATITIEADEVPDAVDAVLLP